MTRRRLSVMRCLAASLCVALLLGPFGAALALSEAEARGKAIYFQGQSTGGGSIEALVGDEEVALPASAVPCAGCHGPDGLGRPEGGVLPPDIRWSTLTKVYGHVHEDGRRHPAFDEASVARVLASGLDPADNAIDRAMPLYRMSDDDMADLIAYLKVIESDLDPGISDSTLQVGSLLPLSGPRARLGQAMAQVLHAHFSDLNARGGIYGRRVELLTVPYGESADATLDTLRDALRRAGIFALVGAYTVGLDEQILDVLRTEQVPLVGPFTLDPGDQLSNAAVFYMYPGFDEQARTLADQALDIAGSDPAPIVIVGPQGARVDRVIAAVEDQLRGRTPVAPVQVRYAPGELDTKALAATVGEHGAGAVFFFDRQPGLDAALDALEAAGQAPRMYLLSSLVSELPFEAPPVFDDRIFIAYPTLSSDIDDQGRAAYRDLAQRHGLPPEHVQAQIAAYAAAKLLEEGLRRAGARLDRTRLVEGLEALYAFRTGLTPPLTYGPNRRIGARGAHVVAIDLANKTYQPVGGWHELR
ncbi:MAG: ABC transporter substrate-binding protein [Gammaproteobacteria bacterium]|nr:ABC transporter substrate-binding protein [Gammaproteobacteria bacterium]